MPLDACQRFYRCDECGRSWPAHRRLLRLLLLFGQPLPGEASGCLALRAGVEPATLRLTAASGHVRRGAITHPCGFGSRLGALKFS